MDTFRSLYRYECQKIWNKKLVKISFAVCFALVVVMGTVRLLGSYVVDGVTLGSTYDEIRKDQAYAKKLNGRKIDQTLLNEMVDAYRKVPVTRDKHYSGSPEYQKYARPYNEIFNFTIGNTNLTAIDIFEGWEPSEQDLYTQRVTRLEETWRDIGLSETEIDFWTQRVNQIEKPITFQENETYNQMFLGLQTIGFIVILFLSISLSGVFPDEHSRRTDQLVLSSPMGKNLLYWVKISAGVSYAVAATLVFFAVMAGLTFALYGGDGFDAAFQLHYRSSSDPITCGQALLIGYANVLIVAILISILVMVLSEILHNSMAAMAISAGLLTASMVVAVPEHNRIFSQLWDWLPWCFPTPWNIFGKYTLSVFSVHLTPWQAAPIIYALLGIAAACGGKLVYERYQVSGR